MGCPNCDIESVITLSICPRCGTMVNDSVREKLATRITPLSLNQNELKTKPVTPKEVPKGKLKVQKQANPIQLSPSPKNIATRPANTSEIVINKTNRTLIEFQSEQTKLPEWRLQLQNAVSQRGKTRNTKPGMSYTSGSPMMGNISATAAVAVDINSIPQSIPVENENPLINSALKRIEISRRKFLIEETQETVSASFSQTGIPSARKDFPFAIAQKTDSGATIASPKPPTDLPLKPTLVHGRVVSKTKYDTSELDPYYIEARVSTSFEKRTAADLLVEKSIREKSPAASEENLDIRIIEDSAEIAEVIEVADDLTPFAVRFNSGLFDFIIGSFISLIFLSPFMLLGGSWFTVAGVFGFLATFAVVMFIYLTTTIGIFGKSFGMHLFSLEMIDIGGEEYPTFHQAAVSSSVYLLSMAFGGIGFLTSFFDEDKRAFHDLVSGTIVVKEL